MEYLDPASSDEEYFPTAEQTELEDDEMMDSEEDEEENGEEIEVDGPNDVEYIDGVHLADEEVEADLERILLQSNPGFLRQIQQVLQHGIRMRGSSSSFEDLPSTRRRRRLQELPPLPYEAGKHLLYSGEFGEIDDRIAKKRRYESPRTLTQFARFRELGWRRESTLAISKKWLPAESKGRMVAHYERYVYSGQFSHDGSFFYTASQDFKCRMYQTLNPANPRDWKLYKVLTCLAVIDVDCSRRNCEVDDYGCNIISR
jgi:hypothetical protein